MTEQFSNCTPTALSAGITATQTTISVADASTYPLLGNFRIAVQIFDASGLNPISTREIMIVTAVAGNTWTVSRAQESTKALAYPSGTRVVHVVTAAVMTALATGGGVTSVNSQTGAVTLQSSGASITFTNPSPGVINAESVSGGAGTVTTVSVATANGFAGTVANATSTPAIIMQTSVTGLVKGNGTALSASKVTVTEPAMGSTLTIQDGFTLTASGNATVSGTNTGDQTITLTSDVTGSGTGSFATTVAKIQGTTVSGTTGTTNVVFSTAPTMSNPVVGTQATSDNSTKAASTAYVTTAVNNAIAGVNPAVAVQYATTQASDTSGLTYSNGVAGIGATLTGANNATTAIDGHTFVVGDVGVTRILVKNDTQSPSGAFNGVYLFTALHTVGTGDVFTRALDFDTSSDINNTGAIPVVSGTANASTSWVITSTVTTVGTDPITFTQFSLNPTTLATLTGTQTLTNKRITKRIVTAADATSVTPNTDNADITYQLNTQAGGTLTINADTGTPTNGQMWIFKIKSTNAQTYAWNAQYVSGSGTGSVTLPTASTAGKIDNLGFIYDTVNSKWQLIAYAPGY